MVGCVFPVQHGRAVGASGPEQIPTHQHESEAGRADIFLRTRINNTEPGHINGPGQQRGRHIRDQGGAGIGYLGELKSANGLVGAVVEITTTTFAPGRPVRYRHVVIGRSVGDQVGLDKARAFGVGLLGPLPGYQVIGGVALVRQVHGNSCKLLAGSALQEQHGIVIGYAQQPSQRRFSCRCHLLKSLTAMTDLHNRGALTSPFEQFIPGFGENRFRQCRGTGTKIVGTCHGSGRSVRVRGLSVCPVSVILNNTAQAYQLFIVPRLDNPHTLGVATQH